MIYKFNQIVNQDISTIKENRICFKNSPSSNPTNAIESPTNKIETTPQSPDTTQEALREASRTVSQSISNANQATPVLSRAANNAEQAINTRNFDTFRSREEVLTNASNINALQQLIDNPELQKASRPEWLARAARRPDTIRRIFAQQEISNYNAISTYSTNLGITTGRLNQILNEPYQGTARNLEVQDITADRLLTESRFGRARQPENAEEYLKFNDVLTRINELNQSGVLTPAEQVELRELVTVSRNIQLLLQEIRTMEHSEARNLSSDYITETSISPDAGVPESPNFNPRNRNDRLTLLAVLVQVYGPINSLQRQGIIKPNTSDNIHNSSEISITNLGSKSDLITTIMSRYREIFDGNRRTANLTEAIFDLRNKDHYSLILEEIRNYNTNSVLSESNDNSLITFYLDQLFTNRLTGPTQSSWRLGRGSNRISTEDFEIDGQNVRAEVENDIVNQSYSDPAMVNYLTSRIQTYENGRLSYNLATFETEIKNLLSFGKTAILMAVDLSAEERSRLSQLDISNFSLNPPRALTNDEVQLIRRGIILQNNAETAEARATLESISNTPEHQAIYQAILNNPRIDRTEAIALTNKTIELLVGLDLSNLPEFSLQDIRAGLNKEIVIWQNQDGKLQVGVAGGTTTPDFSNLAAGITPVIGLQVKYSPTEGIGAQGGLTVGIGTITGNAGLNFNFANEMQVRVNAGGGLLLGIPTVMANASIGQNYQARVNRSIESGAESFLGSLDARTIQQIANGTLSRDQVLEIANQEPLITELFESLPEDYRQNLDSNVINNLKIYFVETLCQNLVKEGIFNARGIGWEVGLTVVYPVGSPTPIFIPILRMEFRTGTRMYYSERIAASQVNDEVQATLSRQLQDQFSQTRETSNIEIVSESGIISYDAETGSREVITAPIQTETPDVAELTRASSLNRLNSIESQIGIRFREAIEQERTEHQVDYVFSVNDFSELSGLTPNRIFHIYNDPASNFKIVDLGHNKIGINFGSEGALPPSNLAITRSEQISAIGSRPTPVAICFTNRVVTPQEVIQNPFASQVIEIDSTRTRKIISPYANLEEGRGEYSRTALELLTEPRTELNFTPEEIASGTALLKAVRSSASTERLSPSPELQAVVEGLLSNRRFREELMSITTNRTDSSFNTVEFRNLLARYLDSSQVDLTDSVIMYLESVLIPGTFRDLSQINGERRRLREINRVTTEVMGRFVDTFLSPNPLNTHMRYNENGKLVEYTSAEKATIRNWLINMNILTSESSIAEQLANLDSLTNALDDLSQGTVLLTTAGVRNIAESQGFREMILNPNTNIQILGTPRTLNLSGQYPNEILVASFIQNIVEPPFRDGEIQDFEPQELQHLFNSQTVVKFLEMNFQYTGQQLPVLSALYGVDGANIVRELYSRINNPKSMKEYVDSLDPTQLDLLNHFTGFMREIRSKAQNGTTINLIQYGTDRNLGQVTINIEAGTVFIANCGNLTMFYNSGFSATINHSIATNIISATSQRMNEVRATAQAQTFGVGIAVRIPGTRVEESKNPEDTPEDEPSKAPAEAPTNNTPGADAEDNEIRNSL